MKTLVRDTYTEHELPKHRIYAVSYEPFWQKMRSGLVFNTVDGVRKAIAELNHYVAVSPDGYTKQCRAWRAFSCVNAVPIGQPTPNGLMSIPRDAEDDIVTYRNTMRQLVEEVGRPAMWDWDVTRKSLALMAKNPLLVAWLAKHYKQMGYSRGNAYRRQAKPELCYYLKLVSEVIDG